MNEAERHAVSQDYDANWDVTRPASRTETESSIQCTTNYDANWDVTRPASRTKGPNKMKKIRHTSQSNANWDVTRPASRTETDSSIQCANNCDARRAASQLAVRKFCSPFYDPDEKIILSHGHLPHWHQFEKIQFLTFHLADSIPQTQLNKLKTKIKQWQERHPKPWKKDEEEEYYSIFGKKIDEYLDAGYGSCCLEIPEVRTIVKEALFYFHGQRYQLLSFVIMSNHVHVLLVPFKEYLLGDILHSWKSFTAHKINRILRKNGSVWHKESFDRIIRNENHFQKVLAYIRQNAEYGPCGPDTYWKADSTEYAANWDWDVTHPASQN